MVQTIETEIQDYEAHRNMPMSFHCGLLYSSCLKAHRDKPFDHRIATLARLIPVLRYYPPAMVHEIAYFIDFIKNDYNDYIKFTKSLNISTYSKEQVILINLRLKTFGTIMLLISEFECENKKMLLTAQHNDWAENLMADEMDVINKRLANVAEKYRLEDIAK
jgi:hypothetical protein